MAFNGKSQKLDHFSSNKSLSPSLARPEPDAVVLARRRDRNRRRRPITKNGVGRPANSGIFRARGEWRWNLLSTVKLTRPSNDDDDAGIDRNRRRSAMTPAAARRRLRQNSAGSRPLAEPPSPEDHQEAGPTLRRGRLSRRELTRLRAGLNPL